MHYSVTAKVLLMQVLRANEIDWTTSSFAL